MSHLDLSEIHSSLMSSFILGMILRTSPVLWVMTMLLPTQSNTSTVSVFLVSQGRAMKAYGLLVRAPTGHKSTKKVIKIHEHKLSNLIPITFPDSSLRSILSTYIPICMLLPRPVVPRSSTPATSEANLTHLVHWIHLTPARVNNNSYHVTTSPGHHSLHQWSKVLVLHCSLASKLIVSEPGSV